MKSIWPAFLQFYQTEILDLHGLKFFCLRAAVRPKDEFLCIRMAYKNLRLLLSIGKELFPLVIRISRILRLKRMAKTLIISVDKNVENAVQSHTVD